MPRNHKPAPQGKKEKNDIKDAKDQTDKIVKSWNKDIGSEPFKDIHPPR